MVMNYEVKNLIERLCNAEAEDLLQSTLVEEAANLLEQMQERLATQSERLAKLEERISTIYSQPVELPEPSYFGLSKDHLWVSITKLTYDHILPEYRMTSYTAYQLTKAVQEATARALGAAAKECEARYMGDNNREDLEAKRCASAIRNLIGRVE